MFCRIISNLTLCLLLSLGALASAGTTYYVSDADGDDSNTGGINDPFKTILKAVQTATTGTSVLVM